MGYEFHFRFAGQLIGLMERGAMFPLLNMDIITTFNF